MSGLTHVEITTAELHHRASPVGASVEAAEVEQIEELLPSLSRPPAEASLDETPPSVSLIGGAVYGDVYGIQCRCSASLSCLDIPIVSFAGR